MRSHWRRCDWTGSGEDRLAAVTYQHPEMYDGAENTVLYIQDIGDEFEDLVLVVGIAIFYML